MHMIKIYNRVWKLEPGKILPYRWPLKKTKKTKIAIPAYKMPHSAHRNGAAPILPPASQKTAGNRHVIHAYGIPLLVELRTGHLATLPPAS
jgi:hypothetical protein